MNNTYLYINGDRQSGKTTALAAAVYFAAAAKSNTSVLVLGMAYTYDIIFEYIIELGADVTRYTRTLRPFIELVNGSRIDFMHPNAFMNSGRGRQIDVLAIDDIDEFKDLEVTARTLATNNVRVIVTGGMP